MRHLRGIAILLLLAAVNVCSWQAARAQASVSLRPAKSVRLRSFSMADGMPSNSVAMMSVAPNGMLWIATWNGLCNYDGYRFNSFLNVPGAKTVLHGNRIKYAYPTDNGDVWLTTFDDRLFRLDADGPRYVDCSEELSRLGLDDFHAIYMQPLADGRLWIQGSDGVNLTVSEGTLKKDDGDLGIDNTGSYTDSKGRVWSMGADGEVTLDGVEYTCDVPSSWPRTHTDVPIMLEDRSHTMWFMPDGGTLCYFDESACRLVPVDLREVDRTLSEDIYVTQAEVDRQKNLWFRNGTNLCQLSFRDNSFIYTPIVDGAETRSIFVDSDRRLWLGTRQGHLARMEYGQTRPVFITAEGGISPTPVIFDAKGIYAIHQDRDRNIWVGTRGSGVYRLATRGERYTAEHFTNRPAGDDTGYSNIYDILQDSTGRVWLACYGGGIAYYDPESRRFYSCDDIPGLCLPDGNLNKVRRVEAAPDGTLLFATTEGVVTLDSRFRHRGDISMNVTRYTPGAERALLAPDVLQTLVTRSDGTVYVASMGGGLQRIEPGSLLRDSLGFLTVEHNFPNMGNIRGMVEDLRGNVWLIGENAIHCLAVDERERHTYTSNDWDRANPLNEARPILDSVAGRILLGTMGGIISFNPSELQPAGDVPVIVFTGIQYQGEGQQTPLIGNAGITMPTDRHNATVYFAALDYEDNLQIRYAYRIRGLDDKWNYVGAERCAPLSNLPPGRYTLEVRSTNNEGVWVDNNTEIPIYVEPTFWQTPWAWALYILLAALLVVGSIYLLWLRKRSRIEKDINRRQLRFFTDISHRVRTPLTLIGGPVSEVLASEPLSDKARTLLQSVKNNSDTMLRLVDEALDFNKLRDGGADPGSGREDTGEDADTDASADQPQAAGAYAGAPADDAGELTILVVEDNDELRYLLKASLSQHYRILEAPNGKAGLRMAAETQPDFIITDIMMPEMDGITMLRRIKSDPAISHIPIIILSARTADIYRIEGLREGADDYITKPFSMPYLQVRVESIVRQRRMLQEQWRMSLGTPAAEAPVAEETAADNTVSAIDRKFVENITAFVNDNIQDQDLKIDDLASAMCMSRTVLYGKVKAIFGMAPNDVVRSIRMARACTLLRENPQMSVADVALGVGYADPKYFARYFRQSMGMTPSEYRKTPAQG